MAHATSLARMSIVTVVPSIVSKFGEWLLAELMFDFAAFSTDSRRLLMENIMAGVQDSVSGIAIRRSRAALKNRWALTTGFVVAGLALLLLALSLGGYFYHREQLAEIAAEHLRLIVAGPTHLQAGGDNHYSVHTTLVTGEPVPARVELAVFSPHGELLMKYKDKANRNGKLRLVVPGSMNIPSGARLEILAVHDSRLQRFDTRLVVEKVKYVTQLSLDKSSYFPGETIFFRSVSLTLLGLAVEQEMPIHYEIFGPDGNVLGGSRLEGVTKHGVGNGAFRIPKHTPNGRHTLVVSSLSGAFESQKRTFWICRERPEMFNKKLKYKRDSYRPGETVLMDVFASRLDRDVSKKIEVDATLIVEGRVVSHKNSELDEDGNGCIEFGLPKKIGANNVNLTVVVDDGEAKETISRRVPIELGNLRVEFFPESGELVPGVENRVYFAAKDSIGRSIDIEGRIVDDLDEDVNSAKTAQNGMGIFSFVPSDRRRYRLVIDSPSGVKEELKLPEVLSGSGVALDAGCGVFGAGEPLKFRVRTNSRLRLPLIASVSCRGVQVGHKVFTAGNKAVDLGGEQELSIDLDSEISGVMRLALYDYSQNPPIPVAERLVFREPAMKLRVEIVDKLGPYSPGEKAVLRFIVTDQWGEGVRAALAVAVVGESVTTLAKESPHRLINNYMLTSELGSPDHLEDANFCLTDGLVAKETLDLLLGTERYSQLARKSYDAKEHDAKGADLSSEGQTASLVSTYDRLDPPVVFDSLGDIRRTYRESLSEYWADRTRALHTITAVSFFGGVALVILVSMLTLLNVANGPQLWVPAVATAAVCLLVGAALISPGKRDDKQFSATEFVPFDPTTSDGDRFRDSAKWLKIRSQEKKIGRNVKFNNKVALNLVENGSGVGVTEENEDHGSVDLLQRGDSLLAKKELKRLVELRERIIVGQRRRRDPLLFIDEAIWKRLVDRYRFASGVYSHQHAAKDGRGQRDFTKTLFWNPMLLTNKDGIAEIEFEMSDSVGAFSVAVDGHTHHGGVGANRGRIVSRKPFRLETGMLSEVTVGDRVDLKLTVINDVDRELAVDLRVEPGKLTRLKGPNRRKVSLDPQQRVSEMFTLDATGNSGQTELVFKGVENRFTETIRRAIKVVPGGFPVEKSFSGSIVGKRSIDVVLPKKWVAGSLRGSLEVHLPQSDGSKNADTAETLIVKIGSDVIVRKKLEDGEKNRFKIDDLGSKFSSGSNRLTIISSGEKVTYSFNLRYHVKKLRPKNKCSVSLETRLDKRQVDRGQSTAMSVKLRSDTNDSLLGVVAVLGIPAGLRVDLRKLEESKKNQALDRYELRSREVICHWDELKPKKVVNFDIELVAETAGRYTGPPSRVYLRKTPQAKRWAKPLLIEISNR